MTCVWRAAELAKTTSHDLFLTSRIKTRNDLDQVGFFTSYYHEKLGTRISSTLAVADRQIAIGGWSQDLAYHFCI